MRPKSVEIIKMAKYEHWEELRERAAIAAMQGLLCAPIIEGVDPNPSKEQIVEYSLFISG